MIKASFAIGLSLSLFIVMAWTGLEYVLWSMPVLPNKTPDLHLYALTRSAMTALLATALVIKARELHPLAARPPEALSAGQWCIILSSLMLSILFIAIFVANPGTFSAMSLEDGIVEWMSALLPLLASALLAFRGAELLLRPRQAGGGRLGAMLLSGAVILFVLGMEEVSWMQRIFGVATPESLSGNIQGEINLHNFATNQIGALHKLGGFAVLVLLPFLSEIMAERLPLAKLMPSRTVALASAPLAAFNYNGWDSLLFQMTTYLTIGIVLYYALAARREGRIGEALFCAAMIALIIAGQSLFLGLGDRFVRLWDVTEYKEFFIALGLAVWAAETFQRLRVPAPGGVLQRSIRA